MHAWHMASARCTSDSMQLPWTFKHLSHHGTKVCITAYKKLVEMEITGRKIGTLGGWPVTPQLQHHQSRSRCHCGAQQLPYFWTPQEIPGWQVVCYRCHHVASCHLLAAGVWWQFLLCWNTGLGGMVGQTLTCFWWIGEGVMRLICYRWVMCTLKPE
jgi:hypothetical protein